MGGPIVRSYGVPGYDEIFGTSPKKSASSGKKGAKAKSVKKAKPTKKSASKAKAVAKKAPAKKASKKSAKKRK